MGVAGIMVTPGGEERKDVRAILRYGNYSIKLHKASSNPFEHCIAQANNPILSFLLNLILYSFCPCLSKSLPNVFIYNIKNYSR